MAKTLKPPELSPTKDKLYDLFRKIVPGHFYRRIDENDAQSLYRAQAAIAAEAGRQIDLGDQASYYGTSSLQRSPPADCGGPAVGQVELDRTGPREFRLLIVPGALEVVYESITYTNTSWVDWMPGEAGSKVIDVACVADGTAGNTDHLTDDDGELPTEFLVLEDQDQGRAGVGATTGVQGGASFIQDTGTEAVFAPEDVGLHIRIDASSSAEDVGSIRRVTKFDWPEVEIPAGSGRYPRRLVVDDVVQRRPLEAQVYLDGPATFTDAYIPLTRVGPDVAAHDDDVDDAVYVSAVAPFQGVLTFLSVPGEGDWKVVWEYWNGVDWVECVDVNDLTNSWRYPGAGVTWAPQADWTAAPSPAGTGVVGYHVRARLSAWVSTTVTPRIDRIYTASSEPWGAGTGVVWTLMDFERAGLEIASVPVGPTGGTDNMLWLLGDNRGLYRQPSESVEAFRDRIRGLPDVVSPAAIQRSVDRVFAPLGIQARACDHGSRDANGNLELPGLFFDVTPEELPAMVSAFDLYEPGDVYPENKWHLSFSWAESHGWFFIKVPANGAGEFGAFFDEGPVVYDPEDLNYGPYLGVALDSLYFDGAPTIFESAVAAAAAAATAGKLCGVGFTVVRMFPEPPP